MKREREFLKELYNENKLPYLQYFQDNKYLKNKLFLQYTKTERQPNLNFYVSQYFTENELETGIKDVNEKIPVTEIKDKNIIVAASFYPQTDFEIKINEIHNEFYEKVGENIVDDKFYSHLIENTEISKKLILIKQDIEDYKTKILIENKFDVKQYSDEFAKGLIRALEDIQIPKLTKLILNDFLKDIENIALEVTKWNNSKLNELDKKYRELKRCTDNTINDYLKENYIYETKLLERFRKIAYLDYRDVNKVLSKLETITDKLNYLKIVKENHYDKFEPLIDSLSEEDYLFFLSNRVTFWECVYGVSNTLITSLSIQEPIYNLHFKKGLNQPEFTYWFLKYNAQEVFNHTINSKEFKNKLNSKLKTIFIEAELKEIEQIENKAKDLLLHKKIDIYNNHSGNYNNKKEIEVLRVLDEDYYKENTTYSISSLGAVEVQAYFKHILLKPYLENLLKENTFQGINVSTKKIGSIDNLELIEKLQNENVSLEEKLFIYNNEIKSLALTDLNYNQPKIPNSRKNIICSCNDCKPNYTQNDFDAYLKIRENEIIKIKQNTNSKVPYNKRVLFSLNINSSKAIISIQKNPFNYSQGTKELYNINPVNENQKKVLKTQIREYENKKLNVNKRILYIASYYQPFELLKTNFFKKISLPLSDLDETIKEEIKTWITPIKKENSKGISKLYNEVYKNIRASKQEERQDNYFAYFYKVLVVEEKIKYEIFLNEILNKKLSKDEVLKDFQPIDSLKKVVTEDNLKPIEKQHLINESFIDALMLNRNINHFIFNETPEKKIVPDNFTHEYLKNNFKIDENITRFYYEPTKSLIEEDGYKEKEKKRYKDKSNIKYLPYSVIVFGAYFKRTDLYYKLLELSTIDKDALLDGFEVKYFSDLHPYFREYAKGFENGFTNFKRDCIDPFLIEFSEKNDYINKVFEFLTKVVAFEHNWNSRSGFAINDNFETGVKRIVDAYKDGLKQGYFYKAWSVVLSNNNLFSPLFERYYSNVGKTKIVDYTNNEKVKIAFDLLGDNDITYTSIVYHHIKEVLKKYGLTFLEGREILLDMRGAFSPEKNKIIIEPIINYLERVNSSDIVSIDNSIITSSKKIKNKNCYTLKEIKIAYFCIKERITEDNYLEILNKYSDSKSKKILQKPIVKSLQLTSISQNKTADTKHLKALNNAKRLLSGINNDEALKSVNQFISTFESNLKKSNE